MYVIGMAILLAGGEIDEKAVDFIVNGILNIIGEDI